ncbi:hypothetical protein F9K33_12335 [bacterium]|nr:MAG: hypothetical protein F9K33_12335 [bacterium]
MTDDKTPAGNSTYKKLAVQWLNETLCLVSNLIMADSLRLRNRQLLVAANRYLTSAWKEIRHDNKKLVHILVCNDVHVPDIRLRTINFHQHKHSILSIE